MRKKLNGAILPLSYIPHIINNMLFERYPCFVEQHWVGHDFWIQSGHVVKFENLKEKKKTGMDPGSDVQ